jgi:hypothetical protein
MVKLQTILEIVTFHRDSTVKKKETKDVGEKHIGKHR